MRNLIMNCRRWLFAGVLACAGSACAQNFGDVVITEVMYNDSFGGADIEWVEIHNTTAAIIDISSWILTDASSYPPANEGAVRVPLSTSLASGSYAVLSRDDLPGITGEIQCTQYFGTWTLGNGGDNLSLWTAETGGTLIDGSLSVLFPNASAPGVSIEKCDPNATWTGDPAAWHPSTNLYSPTGRYNYCTPGAANTPCGDVTPPQLINVAVISNTALDVLWDEEVSQASAEIESNYVVSNGIGSPTLATRDGSNSALVHLTFNPIPNGNYAITINGVQDAFGNSESNQADSFEINITVNPGAVVITEVMYDDTASTDLEWVEIYNTTAELIDISNWVVTDGPNFPPTGEGYFQIPSGTSIVPGAYLVLSRGVDIPEITGEVVCGDSIPSAFNNDGGDNIALLTAGGSQLVDGSFTVVYPDIASSNAGNSIEKCDPSSQWSGILADWHVSTNVFAVSGRYRYCTPGAENSPCVPDEDAPTLVSAVVVGSNLLDVTFNESLFEPTAETAANYSVDNGLGSPTSATLQANLMIVRLTFAATIAPNTYTLTVNNVSDLAGNTIAPNSTIQFTVTPPDEQFIITEFMPNPNFAGNADSLGEWFEVYNAGLTSVDLAGFSISDNAGTDIIESGSIAPGQYFVFCSNGDSATNGGVPTDFDYVFATSGSGLSLSNTGDILTVRNTSGQIIVSLTYTSGYPYSPGHSAQLRELNLDPADPDNWCVADSTWDGAWNGDFGTPGEANNCAIPPPPDTVTICQIRADQDTCGVPTWLGARVVTRGVITLVDTCRTRAWLEDNGCALVIFGSAVSDSLGGVNRLMQAGDSVQIDGYITQFRGLTEFSTFAAHVPLVTYLGTGNVTVAQTIAANLVITTQNACGAESYEARRVKVNNLTFVNGGGTFSHGDSNYVALLGTDTVLFRVDSCDAILGSMIPTGPVNVTAVVGQFDSTGACYCGGYQLEFAGGSPFEPSMCPDPISLTVRRDALPSTVVTLRWAPGLGSTCTTYKVYASTDGGAVFPNTYELIATVGTTVFPDTDPLATKRFYHVTSDN